MAIFVEYEKKSAKENMDFDENLLNFCEENNIPFALRFYGWEKPSVTLGRNQKISGIDEEFCKNNNIDIVRRITGGRALLHDMEITYSIVCNKNILQNGKNLIEAYKELMNIFIKTFKTFNINVSYGEYKKIPPKSGYCMSMSTTCDIDFNGKKFIGSAQYRKNTHLLQHGSIPTNFNIELLHKIFYQEPDFDNIISLKDIDKNLNLNDFMNELKNQFSNHFDIKFENKYFN